MRSRRRARCDGAAIGDGGGARWGPVVILRVEARRGARVRAAGVRRGTAGPSRDVAARGSACVSTGGVGAGGGERVCTVFLCRK